MDPERENGRCPVCRAHAQLLTCSECLRSAWLIDCGHFVQPRPIAKGRADGTAMNRLFCDDCAEVLAVLAGGVQRRQRALQLVPVLV
jgi:hypothetical protein